MNMLISVIVPAYNVSRYIEDCIKSILGQTYNRWELIIVNDGSTDNTAALVADFVQNDARIQLINQENAGVSAARNTGLMAAKGQCVVFLDGDDLWEPEFLAETVAAKEKSNADVVYCGYNRLYSNGYMRKYRYKYPSGSLIIPPPQEPVRFHIGAMLIERELFHRYNITFTVGCLVGQDWELIAKVLAVSTIQSVPRNLMIYRQRKGSTLHTSWNWRRHIHALKGYQRAIDFMSEKLAGATNLNAILAHHHRKLGYQTVKFLWRMVKAGAHQEVLQLMADGDLSKNIGYVQRHSLSVVDSLKYKVVLSKNKVYWNVLRYFAK